LSLKKKCLMKMRMILGIDIDEDTLVYVTVGIPWSMSHCHYMTVSSFVCAVRDLRTICLCCHELVLLSYTPIHLFVL